MSAAVYAGRLATGAPPGLPGEAVSAAQENIANAVAVVGDLPPRLGGSLLAAARDSFADGMNVFATASAGVLIVAAVFIITRLGHVPPTGQEQSVPAGEIDAGPERASPPAGVAEER
ncbi:MULTISPECIES: hypothetical protein [Nonomuraea]|uniref:MFS transporter n=1 Tax=Nonomuraea mangrovi TaxID=2316207 RepID=A0ABW4T104_9ACTN